MKLVGVLALLWIVCCTDQPLPHQLTPIGKTVTLLPVQPGEQPTKVRGGPVHLSIIWGGRALLASDDAHIRFHALKSDKVVNIAWADLRNADRSCPPEVRVQFNRDLEGTAMVCDGSIDLDETAQIEVQSGDKSRTATSWTLSHWPVGVIAATIQVY